MDCAVLICNKINQVQAGCAGIDIDGVVFCHKFCGTAADFFLFFRKTSATLFIRQKGECLWSLKCCDTVVDVDGTVFGKPRDAEDAKRMLRALSDKTHQVHTGVCIAKGDRAEHFVDSCKVTFFPLSEEEIDFYASTKEPYDKAGAYAIQGRAALWLDRIEGDYYTIMGLPVSRTVQLVERFV